MEQFMITERCGTLRMLGREALRGKWVTAFCAYMVYNAAITFPTLLISMLFKPVTSELISSLYVILITGPLTLGCSIFALSIFRNEQASIGQIFYGFERFGKALGLSLLITLFIILWFLIPVAGVVLCIMAALRYSQAFFVMADNPDMGVQECIARSKQLMINNKAKLFLLLLSFIGWALLASVPSLLLGAFTGNNIINSFSLEAIATYTPSMGYTIVDFVLSAGYFALMAYVWATLAAFYEMAAGYLRPGSITSIASTAEIIDENNVQ